MFEPRLTSLFSPSILFLQRILLFDLEEDEEDQEDEEDEEDEGEQEDEGEGGPMSGEYDVEEEEPHTPR